MKYGYQKMRGLKRKLELIKLAGGACVKCGYSKNISAFDFHHRNPDEKDFKLDMRKLSNSSMESILSEFEKCDLLCSNCHREVHHPELTLENVSLEVEKYDDSILEIRINCKPNCVDCGIEINYRSLRCKECESVNRRKVEHPDPNVLNEEINLNGVTWCSKKYNVSRKTIYRWMEKNKTKN